MMNRVEISSVEAAMARALHLVVLVALVACQPAAPGPASSPEPVAPAPTGGATPPDCGPTGLAICVSASCSGCPCGGYQCVPRTPPPAGGCSADADCGEGQICHCRGVGVDPCHGAMSAAECEAARCGQRVCASPDHPPIAPP